MENIQNILSNPDEYAPVLIVLGLFVAFVAVLSLMAFIACVGTRKREQARSGLCLILAIVPTLFGILGLLGHARFVGPGFLSLDLKWIFFAPAMLGILALSRWLAS